MTDKKPSFAIIGAGIGGLTLAACLKRVGIDAPIYEQAAAFGRVGAGLQFSPNAMKVMRGIGLEGKMREIGYDPEIFRSRQWDTAEVTNQFRKKGVCDEKYGAPYLMFHRADVHATLFAAMVEPIPAASMTIFRRIVPCAGAPSSCALFWQSANSDIRAFIRVWICSGGSLPVTVTGPERAALWEIAIKFWPPYVAYQEKAGDREIPVVVLDPIA